MVGDDPIWGLRAWVGHGGEGRRVSAALMLPLTDQDALELIRGHVAATIVEDCAVALIRASRIAEDQPDVWRIELPIGPACGRGPCVWVGPARSNDDDPFVRRLSGLAGMRPQDARTFAPVEATQP
jgi:hypothetical protein